MQASTISTPTVDHCGTIFVAIELSHRSWLVTMHSPDRDRISRHKLAGGDHAGLLALIEHVRQRVAGKLGTRPAVVNCYEAGYDGFWLHHLLTAAGITNHVFDPASIAVEQRGRRAKTDRIDGEQLLRTLMAYCRGEPRVVRVVHVPSADQEDARRDTRERDRLVKERVAHINRIKSLLRLLGMAVGHPRRRDWLAWLSGQRDWQGRAVPPRTMTELEREHARLMLVCEQLAALEKQPASRPVTAAAAEMVRRQDRLLQLKALGLALSRKLTNEVFYKEFRNHRQVGAYVGLAPSPWQSGKTSRDQGISKAGNPRARQAAIELAWLWILHQPDSALTHWFRQRTDNASSRIKRIAIVALARKLVVALWRYLTTGLVPEGAVLKSAKA
jgi:transposase